MVMRALHLARGVLKPGGCFLVKVFHGCGLDAVIREMQKAFNDVAVRRSEEDLLVSATVPPGGVVAVESPTYFGLLHTLEILGLKALDRPGASAEAVEVLSDAGFPLLTNMQNVVTTVSHMANYQAHRERFLKAPEIKTGGSTARRKAGELLGLSEGGPRCPFRPQP